MPTHRSRPSLAAFALAGILATPLTSLAGEGCAASEACAEEEAIPEPLHFESAHRLRLGDVELAYTAVAGTLELRDEEEKPIAHFGYTAYLRDGGDRTERPVLFAYNGGPGSASLWLHMGILGPQRTELEDLAYTTEGPFRRVPNEHSVLDVADLVMIDPVGTGFSRAVGEAEGEDFWGVDEDIASVSAFIVRWLTEHGRWASPKYLLGESYGGIRSGGVAHTLLTEHDVALNGVVLVSPYMNYAAGNAGTSIDLPYVNYLTTFAATAWYHETVEDRPEDLETFVAEAEAFALNEYAPVLLKGARASKEERDAVLAGMERFTGIDADFWDRANLRIDEGTFAKELLRDRRQVVGRIDARYVGDGIDHIDDRFAYDPFFPAIGPAFVATFNDYYREELGVETTREYVTSAGLWADWEQAHREPGDSRPTPVPNTGVDLARAMQQNPNLRLLVLQGYYDLATPLGATRYFLDHMELAPRQRANVTLELFEAGHMMYVHPGSMPRFAETLRAFVRGDG